MSSTTLKDLDGLSFRANSANLPHPVDLSRWSDAGYYTIDTKSDCFRLTEAGKVAALALDGTATRSQCACQASDAYDCWAMRYGMGDDTNAIEEDGGPCLCSCHDEYEETAPY